VANVARPDTILAWYRMAKENRDWGYDRIAGSLANLGYEVCDQTVGNVLQRHALPPAPERKRTTPWPAFIRTHLALLAGTVHRGGADAAWAGDLLRAVFHPVWSKYWSAAFPATYAAFGNIIPEASLLTTTGQGAREQALPYFRPFQFFDHTGNGCTKQPLHVNFEIHGYLCDRCRPIKFLVVLYPRPRQSMM
jgi:hypothetical protein